MSNVFNIIEGGINYRIDEDNRTVTGTIVEESNYMKRFYSRIGVLDKKVLDLIREEYKDYGNCPPQISAIAKCDPADKFDARTGMRIVQAKIDRKRHFRVKHQLEQLNRYLYELHNIILEERDRHVDKIIAIEEDYVDYYLGK